MLVFVLNQAQKANTGKIQTPVYENVREFGEFGSMDPAEFLSGVTRQISIQEKRQKGSSPFREGKSG